MDFRRALALLFLGALACGSRAHTESSAPPSRPFHRAPIIDGSRHACLEPPFTPGEATVLADGSPVTREEDGRAWGIVLAGERPPNLDEVMAALETLRAQPHLRFVSHGLYCGNGTRFCLHLEENLCEGVVEHAFADLRAGLAAIPSLAGMRLELRATLVGRLGPRCEPGDRTCSPIPYERGTRYDPLGSRFGGAFASHSGGACEHDGDCVVIGCGNHCFSWEHGGAHEAATCEGYMFPQPIFCGCIEDQCQWFRQR